MAAPIWKARAIGFAVAALAVAAFTFWGLAQQAYAAPNSTIDPDRPECPHSWAVIAPPRAPTPVRTNTNTNTTVTTTGQPPAPNTTPIPNPWPTTSLHFPNGFSTTGYQSNVPEFNDCQALILPNNTYGPLMAVFASSGLDTSTIVTHPTTAADSARNDTNIIAAAEVLVYHASFEYVELGAGPGFSCLYVYNRAPAQLRAKMVYVKANEASCGVVANPDTLPGKELAIRATRYGSFNTSDDYPSVARWDRDPSTGTMYIGLKCGAAWCEVGPGPATSDTPAFTSSSPYITTSSGPGTRLPVDRIRWVKGWYDEQFLAVPVSPTDSRVVPGVIKGTLFPDTILASRTWQDSSGKWMPAGYVALESNDKPGAAANLAYYKSKFNFDPVPPGALPSQMNKLEFCHGRRGDCGIQSSTWSLDKSCGGLWLLMSWLFEGDWVRITPAVNGPPMLRCVKRRYHPEMSSGSAVMSATARWRWLYADETSWVYCDAGCCETAGNRD